MSKKVEKPYLLEFLILKPNCDINIQHTTIWHYFAYRFSSDQLLTSHTLKCWVISSSRFILILKNHFKDHWSLMKNIFSVPQKMHMKKLLWNLLFQNFFSNSKLSHTPLKSKKAKFIERIMECKTKHIVMKLKYNNVHSIKLSVFSFTFISLSHYWMKNMKKRKKCTKNEIWVAWKKTVDEVTFFPTTTSTRQLHTILR